MSSFTTPLVVSPLPDGRLWLLWEPFEYRVGSEDSEEAIQVPEGFVTDFASVPRAFWVVVPPYGKYGKAAVIHDFLYCVQTYTRKRSDEIFLEAMGVLNVPGWKRQAMYRAVRWFGESAWRKQTPQDVENSRDFFNRLAAPRKPGTDIR